MDTEFTLSRRAALAGLAALPLVGCGGGSAGTTPASAGCLALSRSAKNWWRKAEASRETLSA